MRGGPADGRVVGRRHLDSAALAAAVRASLADQPGAAPARTSGAAAQAEAERPAQQELAGRLPIRAAAPGERVLPLVVYSVAAAEPLLLDRRHVALPLAGLVLAVQV